MTQTAAQYARRLADRMKGAGDNTFEAQALMAQFLNDADILEEESKYNGWTNRGTWLVNLHLTNDKNVYDEVTELLTEHKDETLYLRGEVLQEYVEEFLDISELPEIIGQDATPGFLMLQDLTSTALANVNWQEIVENWES